MKATNDYPGLYVVFEGIIGSGKSTQTRLFRRGAELNYPSLEIVYNRELVEMSECQKLDPFTEAELFARARASSLDGVVRPALEAGKLVIGDRDVFSSLAYQGEGRGLGWRGVWKMNEDVVRRTLADCYVFIDVGIEAGIGRSRGVNPCKFDAEDISLWERTRKGYLEVLSRVRTQFDKINVIVISDSEGRLSPGEVQRRIMERLHPIIDNWMFNEGRVNGERQRLLKERD